MHTSSLGLLKRASLAVATSTLIGLGSMPAFAAAPAINTNLGIGNGTTSTYANSTTANPGDLINFLVYLQNNGDATGTNPRITDTLDSHLTYVKGSSIEYAKQDNNDIQVSVPDDYIKFEGQKVTWGFSNIDPNPHSSIYLAFQARVSGTDQFNVGQTVITNKAMSSFDGVSADTNTVNLTVTKAAQAVPAFADRTEVTNATKGDARWYGNNQPGSASAGDTLRYRVIVTNTGSAAAKDVVVKSILPAGLTFNGNVKLYDDNNNGTAIANDSIVNGGYTIANLPTGNDHPVTITFEAKVTGACTNATTTNKTEVYYNNQTVSQDSASVIYSCTNGLIITKQVLDPKDNTFKNQISDVKPGQVLTYRLQVLNNGTSTINNPAVRDMLPANEIFVAGTLTVDGEKQVTTTENKFFSTNGMVITNLTPGLGKQIDFQVKVGACATSTVDIKNTASVHGDSVAEVSATATATEVACATSTPTPTATATATATATTKPTATSTQPTLPATGPVDALMIPGGIAALGLASSRYWQVKSALKKQLKNLDIR